MSPRLKWPEGRGTFVDTHPDRADAVGERDGRGRFRASPGTVIDVDDGSIAEHYASRGWERVPAEAAADEASDDTDEPEPEPDGDEGDEGDGDEGGADEAAPDDASEDSDASMDYDDFADLDYQDRVDRVDAGDVDHLLDRIAADDGSSNVQDAVEERRTELEG